MTYTIRFGENWIDQVPQSKDAAIDLADMLDCNNTDNEIVVYEDDRAIYALNGR